MSEPLPALEATMMRSGSERKCGTADWAVTPAGHANAAVVATTTCHAFALNPGFPC